MVPTSNQSRILTMLHEGKKLIGNPNDQLSLVGWWLGETGQLERACDARTLGILIAKGLVLVVRNPYQHWVEYRLAPTGNAPRGP